MEALSDGRRHPKKFVQKSALAASVYCVWQERNRRLFTDQQQPSAKIVKDIMELVLLRKSWRTMGKRNKHSNDGT